MVTTVKRQESNEKDLRFVVNVKRKQERNIPLQ